MNLLPLEPRRLFTGLVSDAAGLYPTDSLEINGWHYFFAASESTHDLELWKSDGTAAGTDQVTDLTPGLDGALVQGMWKVGEQVLFAYRDEQSRTSLYASDGTTVGTRLLVDLGELNGAINGIELDGKLVLQADYQQNLSLNTSTRSTRVFVSDGTAAGTTILRRFDATQNQDGSWTSHESQNLTRVGDRVLFWVNKDFWSTDGTDAGTIDLTPAIADTEGYMEMFSTVAVPGGAIFFTHMENDMWFSDGTLAGTRLALSMPSDRIISDVPVVLGGRVYFTQGGSGFRSLSTTDGTPEGTVLIAEWPGTNQTTLGMLADGSILFGRKITGSNMTLMAYSPRQVRAGQVAELAAGLEGISQIVTVGGLTFIHAWGFGTTQHTVRSLWVTDGTTAGTRQMTEIPASVLAYPNLTVTATNGVLALSDVYTSGATTYLIDPATLREAPAAPTIYRKGNRLFVFGTGSDDKIVLYRRKGDPSRLIANVNGYARSFPFGSVHRIYVESGAGDDEVTFYEVQGEIAQRTSVDAGAGNDDVQTGLGYDLIRGGEGNDTIVSGKRDDTVLGGLGDDVINGGNGDDVLDGGAGNDRIRGSFGGDVLFGTSAIEQVLGTPAERVIDDVLLS